MRFLLISLGVLLLAVISGHILLADTGFVIVGFHGHVLRTSAVFFAVLVVLTIIVLYFLLRLSVGLWQSPRNLREWFQHRRRQRAQESLSEGLLALSSGEWPRAEKMLARSAAHSAHPLLHYLGAARAAQAQQAGDRRERYLKLAQAEGQSAAQAVWMTRAEAAAQAGDWKTLHAALNRLREIDDNHGPTLELQLIYHRARREWAEVLALCKRLRKHREIPRAQLEQWEAEAIGHLLDADSGIAVAGPALAGVWKKLTRDQRRNPVLMGWYARALAAAGKPDAALKVVRQALAKDWRGELVSLYGEINAGEGIEQLRRAEAWLTEHPGDGDLLLALGQLCVRNGLWGKARSYLEELIEKAPTPLAHRLLAETLEQLGERDAALRAHRHGLQLATAPATPARLPVKT
ncbi:MAG TPA: heme biosynthesis HemY N-terminal domain-containing protein [Gammaproteobacteria bacterium]|nr:heme biosynthesis HemY N-terminal domain-containing protein [Gammaproteobacteria bacterium]